MPGEPGNFFFTGGNQTCPCPVGESFWFTTNGGANWTAVTNVKDVGVFGFGAALVGSNGYPALYIYGWYNGVGEIWRAENIDSTPIWTQLTGLFPNNSIYIVRVLEGDNNRLGYNYPGFGGSEFTVGYHN